MTRDPRIDARQEEGPARASDELRRADTANGESGTTDPAPDESAADGEASGSESHEAGAR